MSPFVSSCQRSVCSDKNSVGLHLSAFHNFPVSQSSLLSGDTYWEMTLRQVCQVGSMRAPSVSADTLYASHELWSTSPYANWHWGEYKDHSWWSRMTQRQCSKTHFQVCLISQCLLFSLRLFSPQAGLGCVTHFWHCKPAPQTCESGTVGHNFHAGWLKYPDNSLAARLHQQHTRNKHRKTFQLFLATPVSYRQEIFRVIGKPACCLLG